MGGQAKKRRKGLKVTRKQPKNVNVRIANQIQNPEIRKFYDKTKSPVENLRNFGLEEDINRDVKRRNSLHVSKIPKEKKPMAGFVGLASIAQLTRMNGPKYDEANPKRRKISEFDQIYIRTCILKHDRDYKAMERDIQINYFQYSETKMKTLCEKFRSLEDKELLVPKIDAMK